MTIDDYRSNLTTSILYGVTGEDVIPVIDLAVGKLIENRINPHIIARFIDKMILELHHLEDCNPVEARKENLEIAKAYFTRLQVKLTKKN